MEELEAWTLTQLYRASLKDLELCQTLTEISCCKAVNNKEIREKAKEIMTYRKLTPGEKSILGNL